MTRLRTSDGLGLAFADTGSGTPILCLSGLSRNMADFDPVVARFDGEARWIRMDYRGRGMSDWADDPLTYSIDREAEDALELLDHLGLERAAFLGTSRGGLIAMRLALLAPERVRAAILVDIGPEVDPGSVAAILAYLGKPPGFATYADAVAALPDSMAPGFAHVPPETWRAHAERMWTETPDGLDLRYDPRLRQAFEENGPLDGARDLWPEFEALATGRPVALVRGANSSLLPESLAARMQAVAPHMRRAVVPDRGHVPFLDEPQAVALIAGALADIG